MDALQQLAAEAALRKMAASGWLDICTIDKILKTTGATPDKRAYDILSLLHCVHFNDMDAQIRAQLPTLLAEVLGGDPIDLVSAVKPKSPRNEVVLFEQPQQRGWLKRLTGGS